MKQLISRNRSWLLSGLIVLIFMMIIMIIKGVAPFGESSFTLVDSIHQYVPFFSDYQDKLKGMKSLNYTWDVGLGQNFQSLLLYYMASPLNLMIIFFSRKGILSAMSIMISLKIAISASAFSFFLSRRRDSITNNMLITSLGVGFALNNYMLGYFWNIMWLDCIMVFPIIILGYTKLIEKQDPRLYIAALFYSMYCNYYISFIICIFLVLWFLCTNHKSIEKFFLDGMYFMLASFLSAGMAAMSLLMAFLAIMRTSSANAPISEWKWYQSFWELLKSIYILTKPMNMNVFDGKANLYCSIFAVMTLFIYLFARTKKTGISIWDKWGRIILIAFFLISMNNEKLNFIWHGFHNQYGIPNRFNFLFVFVLLFTAYELVTKLPKVGYLPIVIGVITAAVFYVVVYVKAKPEMMIDSRAVMCITLLFLIIYAIFCILRSEDYISAKLCTIIVSGVLLLELLGNAGAGLIVNRVADGEYYMQYTEEMEETVSEVEELAQSQKYTFYRQDIVDPIMLDENTYVNVKGVGSFCTTVRGDMVRTMSYLGFYTGANEYLYLGASPVTNDILGVRYVYVRNDDYYPMMNDMEKVLTKENVSVYENKNALGVGFVVSDELQNWNYESNNSAEVLNDFALKAADIPKIYEPVHPDMVVTGEGCTAGWNSNSPDIISYSDGEGETISLSFSFVIPEDGRYFINVRGNYMDNLEYRLDNDLMASDRYQTQLFDLGETKEGQVVTIKLHFYEGYSPDGTLSVYTSKLNHSSLTSMRAALMVKPLGITELGEDYLKGEVNIGAGEMLYTSIPYDEGWKAYVDGEEVETKKIANALLALEMPPGKHEVELRFTPPGRNKGFIVSAVCWLIYIFIWVYIRKKQKKKD